VAAFAIVFFGKRSPWKGWGMATGSMAFVAVYGLILFFANQGVDKQRFRANLIAYFTLLNVGSIATFWLFGLLGREVAVATAWYLPALLVGSFCGMWG